MSKPKKVDVEHILSTNPNVDGRLLAELGRIATTLPSGAPSYQLDSAFGKRACIGVVGDNKSSLRFATTEDGDE